MDFSELRRRAGRFGQEHIFAFWNELDPGRREALIADVRRVDFELLAHLVGKQVKVAEAAPPPTALQPPEMLPPEPATADQQNLYAEARRRGRTLLAEGRVAALVVAGGQGTRLGFDGPKGAFPISPIKKKTLFRLFAESLLATRRRFGQSVPWYIMTSPANDSATRDYFAAEGYFGLDADDVCFFRQGVMPAVDPQGRILLAEKHRLALSPDGHGGTLRALAASGALADLASRGIEIISYFQVDNPLVRPVDPLFIGLHDRTGSQMSSLTVPKASDRERVGVFALCQGRLQAIEYSDLPDELAAARNADGSRTFDAASIAVHVFSRLFVEELTRPGSSGQGVSLPWHRAVKVVPHVDPTSGERVTPDQPNGIKLEMFIFDALPLAADPLLLQAHRGEVFSPVKNATGVDSPETAHRDLIRRAAAWLERCGVQVPRKADGEPDCVLEISSLAGLDAQDLADNAGELPSVGPGGQLYVNVW